MKTKKISIPKDIFEKNFLFQKGGTKEREKVHKSLTGEYAFGIDSENNVNSELEDGEFLQDSNGIKEVEGKKHSEGGEKMALEDGTRILSDYLKVGVRNAKVLNDQFDLGVKASDTYATVVEKFNKKSGLNKITEELEEYIAKLDKQQQETKDETTLALNTQYLTEEINEEFEKKKPLEAIREQVFDLTFKLQEASKPAEKDKEEFQTGGTMTYNGDTVIQLANKYGINPDKAKELIAKFEEGGQNPPALTREQQRERLKDAWLTARGAGYEGKEVNLDAKDYGAEIAPLQEFAKQNKPDDVVDYYTKSGQPMNASHVDILKSKNKDAFKALGLNINKPSASFTTEEKTLLKDYLGEKLDKNFWLEGFTDKKWDWRFPQLSVNTGVKSIGTPENNIEAFNINKFSTVPGEQAPTPTTEEVKQKTNSNRGFLLLPDQTPMTPDSQMAHLKPNRRFETIDPVFISPERQLAEIARQQQNAYTNISMLPDQQAAAAYSVVGANTAEASNKAISETVRANAAAQESANRFNAQVRQNEENAAWQDALNYERNTYLAKANTDQSWRNFYDRINTQQMNDWKYTEMLNRGNAMNPEVQYTPEGYVIAKPTFSNNPDVNRLAQGQNTPTENLAPRKIKTAKRGGRFKK